jgi:hypothetical protein
MSASSAARPAFNRWRLGALVDHDAERALSDWAHANAAAEETAFDIEEREAPAIDNGLDLRDPADGLCLAIASPTPDAPAVYGEWGYGEVAL